MSRSSVRSSRLLWSCARGATVLGFPRWALACAVCFGDPNSPDSRGATYAVLFLLAVTFAVLGGMAVFFLHLVRRSRSVNNETVSSETNCVAETT